MVFNSDFSCNRHTSKIFWNYAIDTNCWFLVKMLAFIWTSFSNVIKESLWSDCDLPAIWLWPVCDLTVTCLWSACDLPVTCLWPACDLTVTCLWSDCDLSVACLLLFDVTFSFHFKCYSKILALLMLHSSNQVWSIIYLYTIPTPLLPHNLLLSYFACIWYWARLTLLHIMYVSMWILSPPGSPKEFWQKMFARIPLLPCTFSQNPLKHLYFYHL